MTRALVRVYEAKQDHLDAYDIEQYLVPEMIGQRIWIPELEQEALLLQRVFLAEKWLALRLHYGHVEPREAGVGNIVNCGAAMYMAPVGIINAGDPEKAYVEAIDIAGAHQSSFGREAAGVFAAAIAGAFIPDATPDSVVDVCIHLAKDGTREAIQAMKHGVATISAWEDSFTAMRDIIRPFDTVADDYRNQGLAARRPSRLHTIEELPVALGFLMITKGDYRQTVLASANYGRDADSIATMGGGIAGALGGSEVIPMEWSDAVAMESRLDISAPGRALADLAVSIHELDQGRKDASDAAFETLVTTAPA
jgi:ADP-ribosylglycohydrolase